MAVVRITTKKVLARGAYAFPHPAAEPFSSEYLVRTDALFSSPQMREYARNIARAESWLYPAYVRFDSAVVKLATPGASPEELRGQFSHIGLDKLQGELELEEGEMLAFPPVSERQAQYGRNGRLVLPHALTTAEWIQYSQKRVLPPRFQKPDNFPYTLFCHELLEAVRGANGTYVMPGDEDGTEQSLRGISGFLFRGLAVNSSRKRKKKSGAAAKRAAKRRGPLPEDGAVAPGANAVVAGVSTCSSPGSTSRSARVSISSSV